MKLPKSFVGSKAKSKEWMDNLDKKIEEKDLMKKKLEGLTKNFDLYMELQKEETALFDKLAISERIIDDLTYTHDDIEDFFRTLNFDDENTYQNSYCYIASMIHHAIKETDSIQLDINPDGAFVDWAGMFMMRGTVSICGNVGKNAGLFMNGGKLIIEGEVKDYGLGMYMRGGEIHINCGDLYHSQIDKSCKGAVYHKAQCIRKAKK